MATEIGIIKTLIGTAVATGTNGAQRTLQAGDRIFQDEVITTGPAGAVEVEFSDGSVMTLGRNSQAVLDNETFSPQDIAQPTVDADVEALQQALLEGGDLSQIADATAAGAGTSGESNEGVDIVQVAHETQAVTPGSGFETTGVSVEFDELIEEDAVVDDAPTAGITTVELDEDDIYNFAGGRNQPEDDDLKDAFYAIQADFENSNDGFTSHPHKANGPGLNDEAEGDDISPDDFENARAFKGDLSLNASFGNDGVGNIVFNDKESGLTSGGEKVEYWVSDDGHSLVAYIEYAHDNQPRYLIRDFGEDGGEDGGQESHVHIIFTAEITDVASGTYQVTLLGPIDHDEGQAENNKFADLDFTISDLDGDTAQGILRLDIDDDSPVIGYPDKGEQYERSILQSEGGQQLRADEDDLRDGNHDYENGDDYSSRYLHLPVRFGADGPAEKDPVKLSADNISAVDSNGNPVALTSNGNPITWEWVSAESGDGNDGQLIGTAEGSTVITITVDVNTSRGYTDTFVRINLSDNLDHPLADSPYDTFKQDSGEVSGYEDNLVFNIDYTATDFDGDSVNGSFTVNIDDDMPVLTADNVNTNEDTTITIDVLSNDDIGADGGSITDFSPAKNGDVVLNEDGTFTYTPADNFSGEDSFTYTVTDGDGDSATATATVNVVAVADAPNLIISVGEGVANTTPQTIDITNVSTTDNGFVVTAYDIFGNEASVSTTSGTTHDGFGVNGAASGDSTEIGSNNNSSERLKVELDNTVSSVGVNFAWLSGIETAAYTFYLDGVQVGSTGTVSYKSDTVDGIFNLSPGVEFDRIDFTAPLNYTDDYLVNLITFDQVTSYSYELNVASSLTDVDGSETLGVVDFDISLLPDGVTLDGTTLTSDVQLTAEQLNQITGSVTSTETSNSDAAITTENAKVEFDGVDATGETADLLIEGTSGTDTIIGGAGDDIIFGGAGHDSLIGGDGEDIFVWNKADADSSHDLVVDFNVSEDVLNLSDLLSDGSHTIEGIEVGPGADHLQLNIKDGNGDIVQEIELIGVATGGDAGSVMQSLLESGAINDGI